MDRRTGWSRQMPGQPAAQTGPWPAAPRSRASRTRRAGLSRAAVKQPSPIFRRRPRAAPATPARPPAPAGSLARHGPADEFFWATGMLPVVAAQQTLATLPVLSPLPRPPAPPVIAELDRLWLAGLARLADRR